MPSISVSSIHRGRPSVANLVALELALVLVLYWRTTLSMASVWQHSATFAHGFVVIPIFLFLVWRQRGLLATIRTAPCYPALLGLAAAGALWLVGELVNVASIAQFAMTAMIPFAIWGTLGTDVVKALGIPLCFLFFAVPFGEFLVPTLMEWTADFAVWAIRVSGVPVYREGNYFTLPSGRWSVVEACSGVRYLIASFMVGTLYAYLSYRSTARRAAFIAASLAVPIVANWLRAYLIVMLGHLTNNRLAVGADHLIYGWIFFGIVMALLFYIGSRWRQDEDPLLGPVHTKAIPAVGPQRIRHIWIAPLSALVLIAAWQPIDAWIERDPNASAVQLTPVAAAGGWREISGEVSSWHADVSRARSELRQSFSKGGADVGLDIAFYRNQTREAKAITSGNQLVATSNGRWIRVADGTVAIDVGGVPLHARTAIVAGERERLLVWQWFWVGGHVTSNEYVAKFYQLISELQGHGDPVAWVIAYTRLGRSDERPEETLRAFVVAMRKAIEATLWQAAAE